MHILGLFVTLGDISLLLQLGVRGTYYYNGDLPHGSLLTAAMFIVASGCYVYDRLCISRQIKDYQRGSVINVMR